MPVLATKTRSVAALLPGRFRATLNTLYGSTRRLLAGGLYYPYLWRHRLSSRTRMRRLHVGCGSVHLRDWINADIDPSADLIVRMEWRLPFAANTLDRIFSEHVMEHVPYNIGVRFLREAHRTLRPGGIVRIAMPDLADLVDGYCHDWRRFDWVQWPQFSFIRTRAQMLNAAFRWWGHCHLYDREELSRALEEAGFRQYTFVTAGESHHADLRSLETRRDSSLIVEATKQ